MARCKVIVRACAVAAVAMALFVLPSSCQVEGWAPRLARSGTYHRAPFTGSRALHRPRAHAAVAALQPGDTSPAGHAETRAPLPVGVAGRADGDMSPPTTAAPPADHQASLPPGLGHHVAEYLKVAAAARAPLVGGVAYDFTAGPTLRGRAPAGDDAHGRSPPAPARPLRIAQYSHVYGHSPAWSSFAGCDSPCQAVEASYGNASAAATADVVVVNLMSPETPWTRPPGQVWVGTYFESPDHYPILRDAATLAKFNYTTGYRPDADFPNFNMVRDTGQHIDKMQAWPLPAHALKQRHPMLATWISNCQLDSLGRLRLLGELARRNVSIASYGRCGPGQAAPKVGPDLDPTWHEWAAAGGPGAEKAAVSAQHLFMFAAENSGCAYYVTEKIFHAFLGGSVPVYVGDAAALKKLAPPGSVIYAADFASTAALADHLHALAHNRTAYEAYLAWRGDPASLDALHRFMALPAWEAANAGSRACALCEFLWAAPRRTHPTPSADLCQPIASGRVVFRLRL